MQGQPPPLVPASVVGCASGEVPQGPLIVARQFNFAGVPLHCHPEARVLCGPKDLCNPAGSTGGASDSIDPSPGKERPALDDKVRASVAKRHSDPI